MLRWERWIDIKLVVLAFVLTAFTLTYPYGRDQGLFDVVGREWFVRGAVPFRDLVEHRPPVVHMVHGVLRLLFGDQTWAARAFDLALTLAGGGCLAFLTVPRGAAVRPGYVGLGALSLAVLHYSYFDFWHTAQIDWMASSLAIFGLTAAVRLERRSTAALTGGLGAGLATLVKPSVAPFALLVATVVALRIVTARSGLRPRAAALATAFVSAAALPWALMLGWFASRGALGDYIFWIVRVNAHYVQHEPGADSALGALRLLLFRINELQPLPSGLGLLMGTRLIALPRPQAEARRAYLLSALLLAAGIIALVSQMKFYPYHVAPCLFGLVHLELLLFADLATALESLRGIPFARSMDAAVALVVIGAMTAPTSVPVLDLYPATLRHLVGELDDRWFARYFDRPITGFSAEDGYLVAMEARRRSRPGDRLSVRGFEPQLYMLARLPPASRFFWTNFITDRRRSLLHDAWLEEESRALVSSPPRFVITLGAKGEVVGNDWHQARAPYVQVFQSGGLRLLELQRPSSDQ